MASFEALGIRESIWENAFCERVVRIMTMYPHAYAVYTYIRGRSYFLRGTSLAESARRKSPNLAYNISTVENTKISSRALEKYYLIARRDVRIKNTVAIDSTKRENWKLLFPMELRR